MSMGMSPASMQFAMGGGGAGGSAAGGSEGAFIDACSGNEGILAFILPRGHQSILDCQRGGLMAAKMPGLFGGDIFEPRASAKGIFADLKRRLSGPMTNGAPPIDGFPIEGVAIAAMDSSSLMSLSAPTFAGAGPYVDESRGLG